MDIKLSKKYRLILLSITLIFLPIFMLSSNDFQQLQIDDGYDLMKPKISDVYKDILIDDLLTTNTTNTGSTNIDKVYYIRR